MNLRPAVLSLLTSAVLAAANNPFENDFAGDRVRVTRLGDLAVADCSSDLDVELPPSSDGVRPSHPVRFRPDSAACGEGSRGYVGTAHDEGGGRMTVNLVPRRDAAGSDGSHRGVAGSIVDEATGDVYKIGADAKGNSVTTVYRLADFPPEYDEEDEDEEDKLPWTPPNDGRALAEVDGGTSEVWTAGSSFRLRGNVPKRSVHGHGSQGQRSLESLTQIDVMVMWTPEAECIESGLSHPCEKTPVTEANIRSLIDTAVMETNVAFALSGILIELNLVHAALTEYEEYTAVGDTNLFITARKDLRFDNDGKMDEVHELRTQYGAGESRGKRSSWRCVSSRATHL